MAIGERLYKAMIDKGFNKNQLSIKAGIHPTTMANWISNKTKPDDLRLDKVCGILKVNKQWLLTGEESIYTKPEEENISYPKNNIVNVANEPCANCAAMQAEINRLNKALVASKEETIAALRGERRIPKANCGSPQA